MPCCLRHNRTSRAGCPTPLAISTTLSDASAARRWISAATQWLPKALCVSLLSKKGFVILPSADQMPGFNVMNQTGIGINPFSLPLVSSNVLDDAYPLKRSIWRTLLA
jgi:hypothetical protein